MGKCVNCGRESTVTAEEVTLKECADKLCADCYMAYSLMQVFGIDSKTGGPATKDTERVKLEDG